MSGFLQKLKSSGVVVDNSAGPDASGLLIRKIEKRYATDPASSLGLELSDDAEVLSVEANSPAAAANIPVGFMIFEVNNEYVETSTQFEASVGHHLNLVVKLQALTSMYELIARILREEEHGSVEEVRKKTSLDELSRTTPRYGFVASDHPIFRRYTARLQRRREAAALMRQREREAEERLQRENRERIQKEMEAIRAAAKQAEDEARKKEEDQRRAMQAAAPHQEVIDEENGQDAFIQVFEDKSTFGQLATVDVSENAEERTPAPMGPVVNEKSGSPAAMPTETESPSVPAVTTCELLALISGPTAIASPEERAPSELAKPSAEDLLSTVMGDRAAAKYVILPSEEYVLKSGEKVVCSLKLRSGKLPAPPPGKPPKMSREARNILKQTGASRKRPRYDSDSHSQGSSSSSSPGEEPTTRHGSHHHRVDHRLRSNRRSHHRKHREDSRDHRRDNDSRDHRRQDRDRYRYSPRSSNRSRR